MDPDYQVDWHYELRVAGYHEIIIVDQNQHLSLRDDHWQEMATWCQANIEQDHWIWLGYNFWFSRSEDAVLFSLRWT